MMTKKINKKLNDDLLLEADKGPKAKKARIEKWLEKSEDDAFKIIKKGGNPGIVSGKFKLQWELILQDHRFYDLKVAELINFVELIN